MMATPISRKHAREEELSPPCEAKRRQAPGSVAVVKDLAAARRKLVGPAISLRVNHTMADACDKMISANQSAIVVHEAHEAIWRPILVLTENDILRAFSKGGSCQRQALGDWMRAERRKPSRVHSVSSSTTIAEAAERLTQYAATSESDDGHHLLITREDCDGEAVDESQFVGILSSLDLARAIAVHMVAEVRSPQRRCIAAPAAPPSFCLDEPGGAPLSQESANNIISLDSDEEAESPPPVSHAGLFHVIRAANVAERPEAICIEDAMKPLDQVDMCSVNTPLCDAAAALLDSWQHCLLVQDGDEICGFLTPNDFLRAFSEGTCGKETDVACWLRGLAQDALPARHLEKTKSLLDAARQMADLRVHHLLITDTDDYDQSIVGVISSLDLAYAIALGQSSSSKRTVSASLLEQLLP